MCSSSLYKIEFNVNSLKVQSGRQYPLYIYLQHIRMRSLKIATNKKCCQWLQLQKSQPVTGSISSIRLEPLKWWNFENVKSNWKCSSSRCHRKVNNSAVFLLQHEHTQVRFIESQGSWQLDLGVSSVFFTKKSWTYFVRRSKKKIYDWISWLNI